MTETAYVELHCHRYFSLLDATSSSTALVAHTKGLNLSSLALTDSDLLVDAMRFSTLQNRSVKCA